MDLSYSQNLEDWHLWVGLGEKARGIYIDIGGGHPVADNVSFWFYERGWRGLIVEPQPALAQLYAHVRPRDAVFQGLVGRATGTARFHAVDRLHGLSSTIEAYAASAAGFGASYRSLDLPMVTLTDLCEAHGFAEVDFLKIDVEGAEADVLAGADFSRVRPKVIVAEAIRPGSGEPAWQDWEPLLRGAGYRFVLNDTLNRFYVAEEAAEVLARFPRTRAAWDVARHMYEIGRAPENPLHPDHALARDLARGLWAALPTLDPALLARAIAAARGTDEVAALATFFRTDAGRAALGRIACGYDGGQIIAE